MDFFKNKKVIAFSLRYGSFGWGLLSSTLFCLHLQFIEKSAIDFAFVITVLVLSLVIGYFWGVIMYSLIRKFGRKKWW
jgi:hypothetical protein